MKIAVVGAGAMGSLFGGLLAEAGNEVWLNDLWVEHVDAINKNGLCIQRNGKQRLIPIKATVCFEEIDKVELVIIFVKSIQTRDAAETAKQLIDQDGYVLTLQNGMGNAEVIADVFDARRVIAGITSQGATILGPGHILHAGSGPTLIGGWSSSRKGHQYAETVAKMLTLAGIDADAVKSIHPVIWDKLLVNIGINAITALTNIKNGELLDLDATRQLSRAAVEEAAAVARAQGIDVREEAVEHVFNIAKMTATNRSSMGQDVDHKRPTEIDAINGFIIREAGRLGLSVPVNQTITALIKTLQYHYK